MSDFAKSADDKIVRLPETDSECKEKINELAAEEVEEVNCAFADYG